MFAQLRTDPGLRDIVVAGSCPPKNRVEGIDMTNPIELRGTRLPGAAPE